MGELPVPVQKAFLRVLQEHRFMPVGSSREVTSDFRLIAATNRDLDDMVVKGEFRKDLLFRLRTFTIKLPPLRERDGDVRDLTVHYVPKICGNYGLEMKGFSPEFLGAFLSYSWPGNVRELVNTLERAIVAARNEPTLYPMHLPTELRISLARSTAGKTPPSTAKTMQFPPVQEKLPTFKSYRNEVVSGAEKDYFRRLMAATGGDIEEACRISGLKRARLYFLLKKHAISRTNPA